MLNLMASCANAVLVRSLLTSTRPRQITLSCRRFPFPMTSCPWSLLSFCPLSLVSPLSTHLHPGPSQEYKLPAAVLCSAVAPGLERWLGLLRKWGSCSSWKGLVQEDRDTKAQSGFHPRPSGTPKPLATFSCVCLTPPA